LAASWAAERSTEGDDELTRRARILKQNFEACARRLQYVPRVDVADVTPVAVEYDLRADRAATALTALGLRGPRFEQRVAEFEARIGDDAATPFELGLETLGELLGFESVRPNEQADPDGVWRDEQRWWFVFEAKTEQTPENPVSPADIRQAESHPRWAENRLGWPRPEEELVVLITPRTVVDLDAAAVAADVRIVAPVVVRAIASRVVAVHRELRARAIGLTEEELKSSFAAAFAERALDSASLADALGARRAADG
jgi:hypothetical protein